MQIRRNLIDFRTLRKPDDEITSAFCTGMRTNIEPDAMSAGRPDASVDLSGMICDHVDIAFENSVPSVL